MLHEEKETTEDSGQRGAQARSVAVLGGGLAGLSVAHRLVMWNLAHPDRRDRRVDITVLEARGAGAQDLGGKCRSWRVVDDGPDRSARSGVVGDARAAFPDGLPGEHGFRFFPGFYRNVTKTMGEIPADGGATPAADPASSVAAHLVPLPEAVFYSERLEPTADGDPPWRPSRAAARASGIAEWLGYYLGVAWVATFVVAVSYGWWPTWTLLLWPVAAACWVLLRWALESRAVDVAAELKIGLPLGETDDARLSEETRLLEAQAKAERRQIRRRFYGPLLVGFPAAAAACIWTDAGWPMYVAAVATGLAMVVFPRTTMAGYWFWRTMRGSVPFDVRPRVLESLYASLLVLQIMCSCQGRMEDQWDATSWWAYIGAPRFSSRYRVVLAIGLTRAFVATRAEQMSARTGGGILAQLLFDINPFLNQHRAADRVLDGPTSEVWIEPWRAFLEANGVRFNELPQPRPGYGGDAAPRRGGPPPGVLVQRLCFDEAQNRVVGFEANTTRGRPRGGDPGVVDAILQRPDTEVLGHYDNYVLATGTNAVQRILGNSLPLTEHDRRRSGAARAPRHAGGLCRTGELPFLDGVFQLETGWMSGIVFIARSDDGDLELPLGHLLLMDSPWALTVIEQRPFWSSQSGIPERWRVVSVNVSDWFSPSDRGVPARFADLGDLRTEVWRQLRRHVGTVVAEAPPDELVLRDAAITEHDVAATIEALSMEVGGAGAPASRRASRPLRAPNRAGLAVENLPLTNADQLLINTARSWAHRPCAETTIDNLYLAGDHVRTWADFASMESADESARWAVRALLKDTFDLSADEVRDHLGDDPQPLGTPSVVRPGLWTMRLLDSALLAMRLPNPLGVVATPIGWLAGLENLFRGWWEGLFRPSGLPDRTAAP